MAQRVYKLRPSAAATWIRCHGMPRMLEGIPLGLDDTDTEVREEGTACHWAAHEASQGRFHGVGAMAPNEVAIDEEMLDAVDMWLSEVRSWGTPALFEQPLHCARIHDECGGVTDACAFSLEKRTVFVGDLKYGFRFVDAQNNWQLICYLAGVLDFYGLNDWEVWVEFVIVQPRAHHREGPVRRWKMPASDLRGQINQLRTAAEMALGTVTHAIHGIPKLTVNDGCGRCAARYRCTAAQNAALGVLEDVHEATPHDLPFAAAEDELRRLQWAAGIVEARITGLEGQIMHGMKRGNISKYFQLDRKAGRKVWKEGQAAQAQAMAEVYGTSITKPTQYLTPTQAEAKLPAFVVDKFAHRPNGALKLVPFGAEMMRRIFGEKPT